MAEDRVRQPCKDLRYSPQGGRNDEQGAHEVTPSEGVSGGDHIEDLFPLGKDAEMVKDEGDKTAKRAHIVISRLALELSKDTLTGGPEASDPTHPRA